LPLPPVVVVLAPQPTMLATNTTSSAIYKILRDIIQLLSNLFINIE
jgi:hypothetical protein